LPSKDSIAAKDLIHPPGGGLDEKPEFATMYVKTHGDFSAG